MEGEPDQNQIDCFGNYAMIGSEVNISGSNWSPKTKLDHYLDPSGKVRQASAASIKFFIMMQKCKDNDDAHVRPSGLEWKFEEDIKDHQNHILDILFPNKNETTDA